MKRAILFFSIVFISCSIYGQSDDGLEDPAKKHLIETSVLSPTVGIFEVIYNYNLNSKNALVAGLSYMDLNFDPNQAQTGNIIIGYRRYLWKFAHIEYQIWTGYSDYLEETENRNYTGLQAFNEFRLGYQFNFKIGKTSLNVTPQFIYGFWLAEGNKPSTFDSSPFYLPNLNFGIKF